MTTNDTIRISPRTIERFPEYQVHFIDTYGTKHTSAVHCATDCFTDALMNTYKEFDNKLQAPVCGTDNGTHLQVHYTDLESIFEDYANKLEQHEFDFIFAMRKGRALNEKLIVKISKRLANNCALASYSRHLNPLNL